MNVNEYCSVLIQFNVVRYNINTLLKECECYSVLIHFNVVM